MTALIKWDFENHQYYPILLPENYSTTHNFGSVIKCINCGDSFNYDNSFTSLQYHTPDMGLGYPVCQKCHAIELKQKLLYPYPDEDY